MVDMVVHRHQLRPTLANLCRLLTKARARPPADTSSQSSVISHQVSGMSQ
jgi:acetyl-CoA carboxylase carboxyl transferase subunit beta